MFYEAIWGWMICCCTSFCYFQKTQRFEQISFKVNPLITEQFQRWSKSRDKLPDLATRSAHWWSNGYASINLVEWSPVANKKPIIFSSRSGPNMSVPIQSKGLPTLLSTSAAFYFFSFQFLHISYRSRIIGKSWPIRWTSTSSSLSFSLFPCDLHIRYCGKLL